MIEHVNNSNANTISHEKCLPVSICKIITQKIHAYRTYDCLHLVDGTKWTRNDSSPHATPQVTLFIYLYIIISVMA